MSHAGLGEEVKGDGAYVGYMPEATCAVEDYGSRPRPTTTGAEDGTPVGSKS